MCSRLPLLIRGAIADMAVENNKCRPLFRLPEDPEGVLDTINVVGVANAQDVPPIGEKACRDVLSESDTCVTLDGDVVVIEDPAKIIETQMARQGGRFR